MQKIKLGITIMLLLLLSLIGYGQRIDTIITSDFDTLFIMDQASAAMIANKKDSLIFYRTSLRNCLHVADSTNDQRVKNQKLIEGQRSEIDLLIQKGLTARQLILSLETDKEKLKLLNSKLDNELSESEFRCYKKMNRKKNLIYILSGVAGTTTLTTIILAIIKK